MNLFIITLIKVVMNLILLLRIILDPLLLGSSLQMTRYCFNIYNIIIYHSKFLFIKPISYYCCDKRLVKKQLNKGDVFFMDESVCHHGFILDDNDNHHHDPKDILMLYVGKPALHIASNYFCGNVFQLPYLNLSDHFFFYR